MIRRSLLSKPLLTRFVLLLMMVVAPVFVWGQTSAEIVRLVAPPETESSLVDPAEDGELGTVAVQAEQAGQNEGQRARARAPRPDRVAVGRRPPFALVADLRPRRRLPPVRGPAPQRRLLRLLN
jgi:hypothetical protein